MPLERQANASRPSTDRIAIASWWTSSSDIDVRRGASASSIHAIARNDGWKGVDGSVTLTAPGTDIALSGPIPDFEAGAVTAAGSTINSCGYTLASDVHTSATWAATFGS